MTPGGWPKNLVDKLNASFILPRTLCLIHPRKAKPMDSSIFTGTVPALMTPCKADRTPDFDKLVDKARELVALGMSAVVYCGSMGDWPLLTDEIGRAHV